MNNSNSLETQSTNNINDNTHNNVIPKYKEEFIERLQDRFHTAVGRYFDLERPHIVYLNVFDHSKDDAKQERIDGAEPKLVVGGTKMLKIQLEKMSKKQTPQELESDWIALNYHSISEKYPTSPSMNVVKGFKEKTLKMEDINAHPIIEYFSEAEKEYDDSKSLHFIEKNIFNYYINDLKSYNYLSLPLIGFANLEGIIHIIFHDKDDILRKEHAKKFCIKFLSVIYENLLLDWDIYDENLYRPSQVKPERLLNDLEVYQIPLVKKLKFKKYYEETQAYFKQKIKSHNEIPDLLLKQFRKNAIMAILIDSYAHNVSAHSLTALSGLCKQRENFIRQDINSLIENKDFVQSKVDLSPELGNFSRFLAERGTFWTGLTREANFGGTISSFYTILWKEFIQNTLYVGTLANSEGISRINFHITIFESAERISGTKGNKRARIIKKNDKGELLDGVFAYVDLNQINKEYQNKKEDDDLSSHFAFKNEPFFSRIAPYLQRYRIFFPSAIVGKHAFFTLIENEIRNIKHYKDILNGVKELTLKISIEEHSYKDNDGYPKERINTKKNKKELWNIGIWLDLPTSITKLKVKERLELLEKDVFNRSALEDFRPMLGGTFQDKICASLLLNNKFTSVNKGDGIESNSTARDKMYYPFLKVGCSSITQNEEDTIEDWELSYRRLFTGNYEYEEAQNYFEENFEDNQKQYYKKFFLLWKGEPIFNGFDSRKLEDLQEEWENPSRFKFLVLPANQALEKANEVGVVRVIQEQIEPIQEGAIVPVYLTWLKKWGFPEKNTMKVQFKIGNQKVGEILINHHKQFIKYFNHNNIIISNLNPLNWIQSIDEKYNIPLVHGESKSESANAFSYRTHGILNYYFADGQFDEIEKLKINEDKTAELLEVLLTRVCFFDDRMYKRIENKINRSIIESNLFLSIYPEEKQHWNEQKNNTINKFHFLVVHLSFIEAFRNEDGSKQYSEKDINKFIEMEVLANKTKIPSNFYLVITTGRGRTEWWNNLKEDYKKMVMFRPVEAFINAMDYPLSVNDDIELKYRIVKALFGS